MEGHPTKMELGYPYDFGTLRWCYHPRLVPRCFPAWSPQVSKSSQTLLKIRWHLGAELSMPNGQEMYITIHIQYIQ